MQLYIFIHVLLGNPTSTLVFILNGAEDFWLDSCTRFRVQTTSRASSSWMASRTTQRIHPVQRVIARNKLRLLIDAESPCDRCRLLGTQRSTWRLLGIQSLVRFRSAKCRGRRHDRIEAEARAYLLRRLAVCVVVGALVQGQRRPRRRPHVRRRHGEARRRERGQRGEERQRRRASSPPSRGHRRSQDASCCLAGATVRGWNGKVESSGSIGRPGSRVYIKHSS